MLQTSSPQTQRLDRTKAYFKCYISKKDHHQVAFTAESLDLRLSGNVTSTSRSPPPPKHRMVGGTECSNCFSLAFTAG